MILSNAKAINKTDDSEKRLFIIGNGFDLAHGLHTSYDCFRCYLEQQIFLLNPDFNSCNIPPKPTRHKYLMPNDFIQKKWNKEYEREALYYILRNAAGTHMDWNQFEDFLCDLKLDTLLEQWGYTVDTANIILDVISDLPSFFKEWIDSVNLAFASPIPIYNGLMDKQSDLAICFNYTETLEKIYSFNPNNVCHIHGLRQSPFVSSLKETGNLYNSSHDLVIGFDGNRHNKSPYSGALTLAFSCLVKETDILLQDHRDFFRRIGAANIKQIYSIGFSFSSVDMPYIHEICSALNNQSASKNTTWILSSFEEPNKRKTFKKQLREAKFKGAIRLLNNREANGSSYL